MSHSILNPVLLPKTEINPQIAPYIACVLFAFIFYPDLDRWLGKTLSEKVEVRQRRFIASHPYHNGSTYSYKPDTWILQVANTQEQGWVRVPQKLYDSIREGDTLFVKGKQGRFSRHWYLEEASKKPPKKR